MRRGAFAVGLLHGLAGRGALTLYGSGLTKLPTPLAAPNPAPAEAPGEYYLTAKDLLLNKGHATASRGGIVLRDAHLEFVVEQPVAHAGRIPYPNVTIVAYAPSVSGLLDCSLKRPYFYSLTFSLRDHPN